MNWMRLRPLYFLISGIALLVSLYAIFTWGFKLSIDFTGGSIAEYEFSGSAEKDLVKKTVEETTDFEVKEIRTVGMGNLELRFGPEFSQENAATIAAVLEKDSQTVRLLRFETVGPTLSQEILRKTYVAIAIAALGILLWIAWQFKSLKFGVSAILAMLHDTTILLGAFAALGHFLGVEVDILFVTAVLTTLSFSVHDTIVVYDRIRESAKRFSQAPFLELSNKAVTETMVRSLNNSLTILFMLFALFLMGGTTIKWFIFALLVGTVAGTYSSPFVAVPLLVTWEKLAQSAIVKRLQGKA